MLWEGVATREVLGHVKVLPQARHVLVHCEYGFTTNLPLDDFLALPRVRVQADMHCVTRWSNLDNVWEGVSTREVLSHVKVLPAATFVMVQCEHGFTTNLPLEDFAQEDCLFAWKHNGQDLEPDHGYPLRLVVPRLYAWKSAKWVRGIEVLDRDRAGFWEAWEHGGYHMRGDPWVQNATHRDGQRFRER